MSYMIASVFTCINTHFPCPLSEFVSIYCYVLCPRVTGIFAWLDFLIHSGHLSLLLLRLIKLPSQCYSNGQGSLQSRQHGDTTVCTLTRTKHVGFLPCFLSVNYGCFFFIFFFLIFCDVQCAFYTVFVFSCIHPHVASSHMLLFPCLWRIVPARVLCAHPLPAREATACSVRKRAPKATWQDD